MQNPTVIFQGICQFSLEDRPIPELGDMDLLIENQVTQISIGTEMAMLKQENVYEGSGWQKHTQFPYAPGYSAVGQVVGVGKGLDKSEFLGKCIAHYGPHARFGKVSTPDPMHYEVPTDVPAQEAVFFALSEVGMNGVRRSKLRWGDVAVIFGAGIIGQLTARYCLLAGARQVFLADISDFRLNQAMDIAGLTLIRSDMQDEAEIVRQKTNGRMADIVFEATGVAAIIPQEFACLRRMGKMVILSSPRGKTQFDFHDLCNAPGFTIIGAHNWTHPRTEEEENSWTWQRDNAFMFELIEQGKLSLKGLISHSVPYTKAIEMYQEVLNHPGQMLAVHFEWK